MGIIEIRAIKSQEKAPNGLKIAYRPKPIEKRSEKMKAIMKLLKPLYAIFLKSHPDCEIKSEVCRGKAVCIHHTEGRGKKLLDQQTWLASCGPCNSYVESHDEWARERGFKKQRIT
jgi:hypothetical protein